MAAVQNLSRNSWESCLRLSRDPTGLGEAETLTWRPTAGSPGQQPMTTGGLSPTSCKKLILSTTSELKLRGALSQVKPSDETSALADILTAA